MTEALRQEPPIDAAEPLIPGGHPIPGVAEEELVGSLAGQHDLDVLGGQTRDEVQRNARGKRDRLVLVPDEAWQRVEELLRRHDDLAVPGSDRAGREPSIRELVRFAFGEPHGVGPNRFLHPACHEGRQPSRIEPAGEE